MATGNPRKAFCVSFAKVVFFHGGREILLGIQDEVLA